MAECARADAEDSEVQAVVPAVLVMVVVVVVGMEGRAWSKAEESEVAE
jgi:hypothetical protein